MGNGKEGLTDDILRWSFTAIIIIGFLYLVIHPTWISLDYDDVCKYNYGKDYIYEHNRDFGKYCVELIRENLTKENPRQFNWNGRELRDMCDTPRFWEFKRWDIGLCDGRYKG